MAARSADRGPHPDRPDRDREPAAHHARRPPGLSARCRRRDAGHRHGRAARLPARPRRGGLHPRARRLARHRQAPRGECRDHRRRDRAGRRTSEGQRDPRRPRGACDPRLWRDGEREGQRASVPPCPCHTVHRCAGLGGDRLARGAGGAGGDPGDHPAHALRRPRHGLHAEPGEPVRADLLDRHPCRRCDRGDREHRPPLGHERRPLAPRRRRRCGWRGRKPDYRGDADRGGRAAADALRLGDDGPLHEPHSRQCLGGDGVLVLRGGRHHALADAEAGPRPCRGRAWRRGRGWRRARSPLSRGGAPDPALQGAVLGLSSGGPGDDVARWPSSPPPPSP